jgi:hypothetical protein
MYDYYSGLDMESLSVTANIEIDGVTAGENLASRFKEIGDGVWQWKPARPPATLKQGKLIVSVRDRQGNLSRIERIFSVGDSR